MKKRRYVGEQIAFALRQAETGTPVVEVVRKKAPASIHFVAERGCTPERSWERVCVCR
jgi:hypothetical protein